VVVVVEANRLCTNVDAVVVFPTVEDTMFPAMSYPYDSSSPACRVAARDNKTPDAQENHAKEVVAGEKTARTPRFVKTRNGAAELGGRHQIRVIKERPDRMRRFRFRGAPLERWAIDVAIDILPAQEGILVLRHAHAANLGP